MAIQQRNNHLRYIPLWHFITSLAILALLIGSIINLSHSAKENVYSASLLILVSIIFLSIFWYARWFALRAQDRAIRAEENLRHFALTGKLRITVCASDKSLHFVLLAMMSLCHWQKERRKNPSVQQRLKRSSVTGEQITIEFNTSS